MKLIYWSGTGNTEEMANLIEKGIKEVGKGVEILKVGDTNVETLKDEKILILGCPSMGSEVLEECEFEPFIESIEGSLKGKTVALFGSYGWGDGEWMRNWEERMSDNGAKVILEPLIVNNAPEGDDVDKCISYGKEIASINI
ncbi:flavodoxin [Clostridium frigidicarnis]|uniref:Flavodoxin n=1 Tax=Clostridium frigidicarnis TaxID=84698 RepID=A0A1I0X3U2_9CLOT|nr:flavodoxin [Clostridium frigidicarnis]SFA95050.1 flavodoxin, short chain [Clostridium frigidicarnis]